MLTTLRAPNAAFPAAVDRGMPGRDTRDGRESGMDGDQGRWSSDQSERGVIQPAVAISPSETINRHGVSWRGMAAEAVGVTQHGRIESRFRAPLHLLALFESGARSTGDTFVEGLPRSTLRNYKRKLILVPAGHEYADWQETSSLPRVAYFYFDPAALPVDPDLVPADASFAPRLFFEDAALWDTAFKLKTLLDSPRRCDRGYGEALGMVLAHELVRFVLRPRRLERPLRGGLAAWQQRVVLDHIEEHLPEQIPLAAFAQLVRLSSYHFSRAFKQSFGMPPHRFHTHRRIERAKGLLAKRAMSVTEIGMALGFSGTSAFTMSFRKVTGMTPTDYRRSDV